MNQQTEDKRTSAVDTEDEMMVLVRNAGPAVVQRFFGAGRTIRVHELTNRAAQRVISDFIDTLNPFFEMSDVVSIRVTSDFVNINDVRINVDSQNFGPFEYLMKLLQERDVEGIDFANGLDASAFGPFLQVITRDYDKPTAFEKITASIAELGIEHVKVVQWVDRNLQLRENEKRKRVEKVRDIKAESNQVFFRTVSLVGEVLKGIEKRRAIQIRRAERLTQQMVDIIQVDESILVGLSSIKNFDEYTFAHSVNVSILSMLIGDRMGLEKGDVARLGVTALLHDIGKTYVPASILNNPGKLNDQDWELMKYHTFFGVVELSRIKALREIGDAFFVALQHHVHYNSNGYPQREGGWNLRLFSRITTIADYFDAMTTSRVYQEPMTPDRALRFIIEKSGDIFDPFLAKVFISAMGIYPIGTIVQLDSGERAVVIRQNDEGIIHRPVVRVLESDGAAEAEIDLARRHADNTFYHSVEKAFYHKDAERLKMRHFVSAPDDPAS